MLRAMRMERPPKRSREKERRLPVFPPGTRWPMCPCHGPERPESGVDRRTEDCGPLAAGLGPVGAAGERAPTKTRPLDPMVLHLAVADGS